MKWENGLDLNAKLIYREKYFMVNKFKLGRMPATVTQSIVHPHLESINANSYQVMQDFTTMPFKLTHQLNVIEHFL